MTVGGVLVTVFVVALIIVALWAFFTAQRLNRLHIRTDSARQSLQAALDRRAAVLAALRASAADIAAQAEAIALTYGNFTRRAAAERAVHTAIADFGADVPVQIVDANVRVELAHRFYNEAVADTRSVRLIPLVRLLRLGGNAPLPEFFEFSPV